MSVQRQAAMLAEHWIDSNRISPMHCLSILLEDNSILQGNGFFKIDGTCMEAPNEFEYVAKNYMVAVTYEVLIRVEPPISGMCLVSARRNHNKLCSMLWERIYMYLTIPSDICSVLRVGRGDLQRFVCDVYGSLLRLTADPQRINNWVLAGIQKWDCSIGGKFHSDLNCVCKAAEIQSVQVKKNASLSFWDGHGVLWTKQDHILVFLLLVFWKPRYCVTPAHDAPQSIKDTCNAPWLIPLTEMHSLRTTQ